MRSAAWPNHQISIRPVLSDTQGVKWQSLAQPVRLADEKERGPKPPVSFAVQAHFIDRPVFFCLRPGRRMGRAHPPRERVGGSNIFRPTLFPVNTGMFTE